MNNHPNNERFPNRPDPWENNSYQTGSTQPPKSYRGLIAALLVIIIFLGGIVSALSLLNVKLFWQINGESDLEDSSVRFAQEMETTPVSIPQEDSTEAIFTNSDTVLNIQASPSSIENIPQEGGLSLQEIYSRTIDSVVSITCTAGSTESSGTGVVISKDGYIVTNCHVVDDAQTITVLFTDQKVLPAQIVGTDVISDLAVLYVDAEDLTPATFGDSGALRVGDTVAAIGDPLGTELRGTFTDGIVSAINRDLTTGGRTMTLIQTNAALNSGNSGGPLLNCYGQVIGINTMKIGDYMNSAGVEGLGFAIPSTTVKEIVDQLISQGYVSGRPALGLSIQDLSSVDRLYFHLPQGILIRAVEEGSNASAVGIAPGDILISFDGVRITSCDSLFSLLYSYQAGDTVPVVVYRSGSQYTLELTIDEVQ